VYRGSIARVLGSIANRGPSTGSVGTREAGPRVQTSANTHTSRLLRPPTAPHTTATMPSTSDARVGRRGPFWVRHTTHSADTVTHTRTTPSAHSQSPLPLPPSVFLLLLLREVERVWARVRAFTAANTAPPFSSLRTLPHTQITTVPLRPKNAASSFCRQCQVRRILLTFPGPSSIAGGENAKPAIAYAQPRQPCFHHHPLPKTCITSQSLEGEVFCYY